MGGNTTRWFKQIRSENSVHLDRAAHPLSTQEFEQDGYSAAVISKPLLIYTKVVSEFIVVHVTYECSIFLENFATNDKFDLRDNYRLSHAAISDNLWCEYTSTAPNHVTEVHYRIFIFCPSSAYVVLWILFKHLYSCFISPNATFIPEIFRLIRALLRLSPCFSTNILNYFQFFMPFWLKGSIQDRNPEF